MYGVHLMYLNLVIQVNTMLGLRYVLDFYQIIIIMIIWISCFKKQHVHLKKKSLIWQGDSLQRSVFVGMGSLYAHNVSVFTR